MSFVIPSPPVELLVPGGVMMHGIAYLSGYVICARVDGAMYIFSDKEVVPNDEPSPGDRPSYTVLDNIQPLPAPPRFGRGELVTFRPYSPMAKQWRVVQVTRGTKGDLVVVHSLDSEAERREVWAEELVRVPPPSTRIEMPVGDGARGVKVRLTTEPPGRLFTLLWVLGDLARIQAPDGQTSDVSKSMIVEVKEEQPALSCPGHVIREIAPLDFRCRNCGVSASALKAAGEKFLYESPGAGRASAGMNAIPAPPAWFHRAVANMNHEPGVTASILLKDAQGRPIGEEPMSLGDLPWPQQG